MTEIRKLIRLTKNAYAVTIPAKYRKGWDWNLLAYVEISLEENGSLTIKPHRAPKKG